jgi:hypothetical protein
MAESMSTRTTADRIPLADLEDIVTRALQPGDYAHNTAWINGGPAETPTPAAHIVNPGILTRALPEPDADGTVDAQEAALSILSVVEERLSHPYTLRAHHLVRRLTEESEEYEAAHGDPGVPATAPGSAARCMVCSAPLKAGSKSTRKTCSDNCRATLCRRRRQAKR